MRRDNPDLPAGVARMIEATPAELIAVVVDILRLSGYVKDPKPGEV